MADALKFEKPPPTAPPPYTETYLTGNPQPPQYGFQQPQPGYPQPGYPQPGYPQPGYPQPGYPQPAYPQSYPPGYPQQQPGYGAQHPLQTTQPVSSTQQTVVIMGGCPSCRVGVLEEDYTCCGILCAICFFPIGILCCLAMKEKKCTNCHATF